MENPFRKRKEAENRGQQTIFLSEVERPYLRGRRCQCSPLLPFQINDDRVENGPRMILGTPGHPRLFQSTRHVQQLQQDLNPFKKIHRSQTHFSACLATHDTSVLSLFRHTVQTTHDGTSFMSSVSHRLAGGSSSSFSLVRFFSNLPPGPV